MAFTLRSPAGQLHRISDSDSVATITCTSVAEASGQWLAHSPSLVSGIKNGTPLEKLGDTFVFASSLDESGEEFIAILEYHRLCVIRLQLDTPKMTLATYYMLLERFTELFSFIPPGSMSVGGKPSGVASARLSEDAEKSFRLVCLAFEFAKSCFDVKKDISQHPRGHAGLAGVDAMATLQAWRRNSSWYTRADAYDERAISCGVGGSVIPLRAVPRSSIGGNLFLGAMIQCIGEVSALLPSTPGGMMAASLIHIAKRQLEYADHIAQATSRQARSLVSNWQNMPIRSAKAARDLLHLEDVAKHPWRIAVSSIGDVPFLLPATELVFQKVAVASMLLALGAHPDECESVLEEAKQDNGVVIGGKYRAWYDTPNHSLRGWRQSTQMPSGYRPDLVVQRLADGAWLLIDAKLRQGRGDTALFSPSAIKDMQSYMQEYNLCRSVILVPSLTPDDWTHGDIVGGECHVRFIGVPATRKLFDEIEFARSEVEEMWNT